MPTYIALFRGINVVGANLLPMKELIAILESLGCEGVRTYIQSGNAVFSTPNRSTGKLAKQMSAAIRSRRGFEPVILLLTRQDLALALRGNPFPHVEHPARLGVGFLAAAPKRPDLVALETWRATSERWAIVGRCFYLHAPDGFGKSKLASRAEKLLGVPMTMRNWRTVGKIAEMVQGV